MENKAVPSKDSSRKDTMKDEGNYHGPPCPHLDDLRQLIGKLGIEIGQGTSISEKSAERRRAGIYRS